MFHGRVSPEGSINEGVAVSPYGLVYYHMVQSNQPCSSLLTEIGEIRPINNVQLTGVLPCMHRTAMPANVLTTKGQELCPTPRLRGVIRFARASFYREPKVGHGALKLSGQARRYGARLNRYKVSKGGLPAYQPSSHRELFRWWKT